ncbi:hypothetical protein ASC77_19925 [Nocardioides sp. Root1257]|nr:hypothetical protein ASC77_19925 [Nocardioides sp. Root1257]KRC45944.1 hypothetical protein ASE24_15295 [Nocardioides sp. Root224]
MRVYMPALSDAIRRALDQRELADLAAVSRAASYPILDDAENSAEAQSRSTEVVAAIGADL